MKPETVLSRFLSAWVKKQPKVMVRYTVNHFRTKNKIEMYISWCEEMDVNFSEVKVVHVDKSNLLCDVQTKINGMTYQFRLTKEIDAYHAREDGKWLVNPSSMRKIN